MQYVVLKFFKKDSIQQDAIIYSGQLKSTLLLHWRSRTTLQRKSELTYVQGAEVHHL